MGEMPEAPEEQNGEVLDDADRIGQMPRRGASYKPSRGWQWALRELLIVVVGVLVALAVCASM